MSLKRECSSKNSQGRVNSNQNSPHIGEEVRQYSNQQKGVHECTKSREDCDIDSYDADEDIHEDSNKLEDVSRDNNHLEDVYQASNQLDEDVHLGINRVVSNVLLDSDQIEELQQDCIQKEDYLHGDGTQLEDVIQDKYQMEENLHQDDNQLEENMNRSSAYVEDLHQGCTPLEGTHYGSTQMERVNQDSTISLDGNEESAPNTLLEDGNQGSTQLDSTPMNEYVQQGINLTRDPRQGSNSMMEGAHHSRYLLRLDINRIVHNLRDVQQRSVHSRGGYCQDSCNISGGFHRHNTMVRGESNARGILRRGNYHQDRPRSADLHEYSFPRRGNSHQIPATGRGRIYVARQFVRGSQSIRGRIYRRFQSLRSSRNIQPRNDRSVDDLTGSLGKTCGICQDNVLDKPWRMARFGILASCNHCYCLSCIMKWRRTHTQGITDAVNKTCPECRQRSDYVCPSRVWIEDPGEKERFLTSYRESCAQKDCWYYARGAGHCYLGNQCFFRHVDTHGNQVNLGPPSIRQRRIVREEVVQDNFDLFLTYNEQVLQSLNFFEYIPPVVWDEYSPSITNMWESANNLWD